MPNKRSTPEERQNAREMWEAGWSDERIGEAINRSALTIFNWRKKARGTDDEWSRDGAEPGPTYVAPDTVETIATTNVVPDIGIHNEVTSEPLGSEQKLRDEVAHLRAQVADLEQDLEEVAPVKDVSEYLVTSAEDLERIYDDAHWERIAKDKLAAERQAELKRGFELQITDELIADKIAELKVSVLSRRTREPQGPPTRTLKMWDPKQQMLRQVLIEGQVNNGIGSLADPIVRYQNKGWKAVTPFICMRGSCYKPALKQGDQVLTGYCSDTHQAQVEGRAAEQSIVTLSDKAIQMATA